MPDETVAKTQPQDIRPRLDAQVPRTAMVLAAGLGLRMRPLTDDRPKALVELGGRALIDHVLDRLEKAGVARAVVNVHAHADKLEAHLAARKEGPELRISDERSKLLDTGGGLKKALPLLGREPVFVVNSDAFWLDGLNDTLVHLASRWDPETMDALLLVVPSANALGYSGRGDFDMDPQGRLLPRGERALSPYVFAGVQILNPAVVRAVDDEVFSVVSAWRPVQERGRLFGLVHEGPWAHVGTPESISLAERNLLD